MWAAIAACLHRGQRALLGRRPPLKKNVAPESPLHEAQRRAITIAHAIAEVSCLVGAESPSGVSSVSVVRSRASGSVSRGAEEATPLPLRPAFAPSAAVAEPLFTILSGGRG